MLSSYSHSSLGTFGDCPRKFKFKYIEKAEVPGRTSVEIYLGSAVHLQLARLYQLAADGFLWPEDDLLAAYRAEWDKPERMAIVVSGDYLTIEDHIENGRRMLERYYDKYKPFNQGILLGAELNIRFQPPGTPFSFQAKIDRLWKRPDGVIEICDYKTGRSLPQGGEDQRFKLQMGLYELAVRTKFPHFEQIELAQYFLKQDEVIRHRLTADQLDELTELFRMQVMETLQAGKMDDFPTRESGHCLWCEYAALCPAKRHRRVLDGEDTNVGSEQIPPMELAADLADRYLKVHAESKALEAQLAELKAEVIAVAKELSLEKLSGNLGDISVKIATEEEFITKTGNQKQFAELVAAARSMQLDEIMTLDPKALKKLYDAGRLSEAQMKLVTAFLVRKERATVRAMKSVSDED
jgi:putative RecB family exonuclease